MTTRKTAILAAILAPPPLLSSGPPARASRTVRAALAAGAALAPALLGAPAQAAPADDPQIPAVHVRYDDLNLATPAGMTVLYSRIVGAAARVCPQADQRDLERLRISRGCQAEAIAHAVQALHDPQLAALHQKSRG